MKLINFTPWDHTSTSIPDPKDGRITYRIVGKPSLSSTPSNRTRSSYTQDRTNGKSVKYEQPDLILTSDHQISILGHTVSKKTLKKTNAGSKDETIKELPQWTYSSRPGEQSSFLPKISKQCKTVGAVLDGNSRSVFSLQNDNVILKIWSLDKDVTGPDEDADRKMVERIELHSPVVSMNTIPYKVQAHVKIKDQSFSTEQDNIEGGVAGTLANGQIFVILISSSKKVKIGFYGNDDALSKSSRRRSSSNTENTSASDTHIFSAVNYSRKNDSSYVSKEGGKKRKAPDESANNNNSSGEIELTTLSLDLKNKDTITFCKHKISLSLSDDDVRDSELGGLYSKESFKFKLPHKIDAAKGNGKGTLISTNLVNVTQLDQVHVCVAYKASTSFFAVMFDTRDGTCINQPFPLVLKSNATVVEIGGLSTSILAVLSSDNLLSLYDVRRSLILHELNVDETFGSDDKKSIQKFGIATNFQSGTIGVIRKSVGRKQAEDNIKVSFAKIGVFDAESGVHGISTKQPLKASYNLARAIASSMTSAAHIDLANILTDSSPLEQDMSNWFSIPDGKAKAADMSKLLERLAVYKSKGGQTNGHKETLNIILSDSVKICCSQEGNDFQCVPQRLIDALVAVAIEFAVSPESSVSQKLDAADVLTKCIKSGKVSGRNHFDRASNGKANILQSLLFSFNNLFGTASSSKQDIITAPLSLIHHLLSYCEDSLPERMLTSMTHFVLCHVDDQQFRSHWSAISKKEIKNYDSSIKVLEKRLGKALFQYKSDESEELKDLIESLKARLAIALKLLFIDRIVTHSKCNAALLRAALREDLSQSDQGEVEVLMQTLSRLLRKAGQNSRGKNEGTPNSSSCIAHWLSALVDANLGPLLNVSNGDEKRVRSIEATKKEIAAAVAQTQAVLGLKQLLDEAQFSLESNAGKRRKKAIDVTTLPLYGIESLTF